MKLLAVLFWTFILFFSTTTALALVPEKPTPPDAPLLPDVPERSGIYKDPQNPNLYVRVFVHDANPRANTTSLVCSNNDSNALDGVTGWHLPSQVTYSLNPSSLPISINSSAFSNTIAPGVFQTWQTAVSGKVSFNQGTDTTISRSAYDGKNVVAFGRTSGIALATTYTRYYTSNGQVVDVDTIFNKKFPWSYTSYQTNSCGDPSSYDVQNILTHELGHWMGLDDEYASNYVDNTMYGYGARGEIKKDTLTTGDTQAVKSIYP